MPRTATSLGLMLLLASCSLMPAVNVRTIHELDTTFVASDPAPNSISPEQAVEALHDKGVDFDRRPDMAQFGSADCIGSDPCCGLGSARPRQVWLIEWRATAGPEWGTFIVDGTSGEVLCGVGGP